MKIILENRMHVDTYVLTFIYAGIKQIVGIKDTGEKYLSVELHEKQIADLMNLCIQELQDIKRQKVIKHDADEGKIKFIGVDYR